MEMTWLETFQLLGVDLLAALLLAVVILDLLERSLQSFRDLLQVSRKPRQRPGVATRLATVSFD